MAILDLQGMPAPSDERAYGGDSDLSVTSCDKGSGLSVTLCDTE